MSKVKYIIGILVLVFIIGFSTYQANKGSLALGSVARGGGYNSTTTNASIISARTRTIISGQGTLGSVIISSSTYEGNGVPVFSLYDGTTTLSHSDVPTTTLATFTGSSTPGTYTFDIDLKYGLIIEKSASFSGSYTTTYRQN